MTILTILGIAFAAIALLVLSVAAGCALILWLLVNYDDGGPTDF